MTASSFRSGNDGTDDVDGFTGTAQVLVIGNGAIAQAINNSGVITATSQEATDEIYLDRDNIIAARDVTAIAINIEDGADVTSLTNSGAIGAVITGRTGEVVAIRDSSGTLRNIVNSGTISAFGLNSDANGDEATDFTRVALDLSNNASGVNLTQNARIDTDTTDEFTPPDPTINGDVLLGSGDDIVTLNAGQLSGALAFGAGENTLSLNGGSTLRGSVTSDGGTLALSVAGSTLTNTSGTPLSVTRVIYPR